MSPVETLPNQRAAQAPPASGDVRFPNTSVPVVVLKAQDYGALGIVRSLGRLGIRVYAIDADSGAPALKSRYCAGKFIWNVDAAPAEQSVQFLREVAGKIGGYPLLIPTGDLGSEFLAAHGQALRPAFRFPSPPPGVVHSLYEKKRCILSANSWHPDGRDLLPTKPAGRDELFGFSHVPRCAESY